MSVHAAPVLASTVVVAVDVGKNVFSVSVTDGSRRSLIRPVDCAMTAPALREVVGRVLAVLPEGASVRVGVEAAGHYHRPLMARSAWPSGRFSS